jgi:hypothetical protein
MASLFKRENGTQFVQFVNLDGDRKAIALDRAMGGAAAENFRARVEALAAMIATQSSLDRSMIQWLSKHGKSYHDRLARVGLFEPREPLASGERGGFIADYVDGRTDTKPATKEVWRQGQVSLVGYFGADLRGAAGDALESITGLEFGPYERA